MSAFPPPGARVRCGRAEAVGAKLSEALGAEHVHRAMDKGDKTVACTIKLGAVMSLTAIDEQCMCLNATRGAKPLRRDAQTTALEVATYENERQTKVVLVSMWRCYSVLVELETCPTELFRHTRSD